MDPVPVDSMVYQLKSLHNYSIISANSDKDEYCIVETDENCDIETAEEYSSENAECNYTAINVINSDHKEQHQKNIEVEYCTGNMNEIYCVQNSDEAFSVRNCERRYCIEISEEIYDPHSMKMPDVKSQAKQFTDKDLELQKLNLIFSNGYHVCDVCNRTFRKKKVDPREGQIVENLQKSDEESSQCSNIHLSVNVTDPLKKCISVDKTTLSDNVDDPNSQNSPEEDLNTFEVSYRTHTFENIQDKLYSCNQCSRHFIKEKSLNVHLQRHLLLGKDPLKCSVCKANFTHVSRLREHFVTHSGEKPFSCVVCKRKFGRNSNLLRHLLTHTGEKKYKCDICNKRYSNITRLKEHYLSHSGTKPHQCNVCKKLFQHKFGLQRHYLTHTGEKPHKCDICNKQFTRRGHLNLHYRTHGKTVPVNNPSNPLDSVFFIPNRVEPRLTKIIKNLEARLMQSSDTESDKLSAEKVLIENHNVEPNEVVSISQNTEQTSCQEGRKASNQFCNTNGFDCGISKRTRVFKRHNLLASLGKEKKANKMSSVYSSKKQNEIGCLNSLESCPVIKSELTN
ncbi:zinc finger protein [Trichonephila clavata]|uniref:Zinc finger protein n=1 Tax=Trichonephila clavata TaxID=2740835 RepID=A0A8X6EWY6_TRICU|nr:zinc finger protein [Trichonephila clavata]